MENMDEIMTNQEIIIEVTDEIVETRSGKGFKTMAGIGLTVLGGVIAYKYVIKPIIAKIRARKEQQKNDDESGAADDANDVIDVESDEAE